MPDKRDRDGHSPGGWLARRQIRDDPLVWTLFYVLVVSALFLAFPTIDLWVTGLVHDPDRGFTLARSRLLRDFRKTGDLAIILTVAFLILQVGIKLAKPQRPSLVPPSATAFLLSALIVGPGILVNVVLKNNWGRPRPVQVDAFGGSEPYVVVWRMTDHCASNCSFVAGEASAALWLVALALVVPRILRLPVAIVAGAYAVLLSANRIAFGGHFLSDVLLGWGVTGLVLIVAYRIFIERPPDWLRNERLEAGLTGFGLSLRRGKVPGRGTD